MVNKTNTAYERHLLSGVWITTPIPKKIRKNWREKNFKEKNGHMSHTTYHMSHVTCIRETLNLSKCADSSADKITLPPVTPMLTHILCTISFFFCVGPFLSKNLNSDTTKLSKLFSQFFFLLLIKKFLKH